jgi:hypothetical protein
MKPSEVQSNINIDVIPKSISPQDPTQIHTRLLIQAARMYIQQTTTTEEDDGTQAERVNELQCREKERNPAREN